MGLFPDVDAVSVDDDRMRAFTNERQFTALAFDLLKEATSFVGICGCVMGPNGKWTRDEAVIGGHFVRIYKLLSAILDQGSRDRSETTMIFVRLAFETIVNLRYVFAHYSPQLVDSYITFSLRSERKLFDKINANVAERGNLLPIEDRMIRSIQRAEAASGIALASINLKDKAPWGRVDLYRKASIVGLEEAYDFIFGLMSQFVHGAWQDILQFHVSIDDDGRFQPDLDWHPIRPQVLLVVGLLVTELVDDFLNFKDLPEATGELEPKIEDLRHRLVTVNAAHETYLSQKEWPEI